MAYDAGAPQQGLDGPATRSVVHDMLTVLTPGEVLLAMGYEAMAQGLARLAVGDERVGVATYRAKLRALLTKPLLVRM